MYSSPNLEPVSCSISGPYHGSLTCLLVSQNAGQVLWNSHLLKNFPQFVLIHTFKGFSIVNKAEVNVFLELSYFFNDPTDVGNLISGSSSFFKSSLYIWNFLVHILLKPGLENFEHYFASMWDECNCAVVWTFFGMLPKSMVVYLKDYMYDIWYRFLFRDWKVSLQLEMKAIRWQSLSPW